MGDKSAFVRWMSRCKLEEFISYEQPSKYIVNSDQYDDSFEIPVLTAGKSFILGYTDETNNIFDNLPVIIFDDFTTSVQFVDFPFKVKSSAMKLLKNTEQADIKYCYYLLKFLQHTPENHKRQWLSATSQNIVELPTIEKQKNIVMKLDKILEVIDNQNKQLELLDEAIKARFVEMFGDNKYEELAVEKVCTSIVDCPHTTPKYNGDLRNPAIRTSEIKKGFITWDTMKYVSDEEYIERTARLKPQQGDIVYGREGTFGNAAILPKGYKFCLGQRVMLLRPNNEFCISQYLLRALISDEVYNQALAKNNASTVAHVNVKDVKNFMIPVPPLELQNQFASFVEEIDKSRSRIQKSLEASQELFDSLMQEYFG